MNYLELYFFVGEPSPAGSVLHAECFPSVGHAFLLHSGMYFPHKAKPLKIFAYTTLISLNIFYSLVISKAQMEIRLTVNILAPSFLPMEWTDVAMQIALARRETNTYYFSKVVLKTKGQLFLFPILLWDSGRPYVLFPFVWGIFESGFEPRSLE